jgi:hypothetical protein
MKVGLLLAACLALTGCAGYSTKGGKSYLKAPSGIQAGVKQSNDPKAATTQEYVKTTETTVQVPGVGPVTTRVVERVGTVIGPAQKNTIAETGAKLASLRPVMYVGIAVFLFGAASLFWPPLKLIVGSTTTSVVACVAGVAMIALPSLIAGNEVLIMCIGVGGVAAYYFAHRHGSLRGKVQVLEKY